MAYTALYRTFRPKTFDEMVGQDHITRTLKNQIIAGRVGHAYLLNGSRGTGKTSAAKILARAINCLNPKDGEPCNECEICKGAISGSLTDIVEMDAASNNGVDDIRAIREEVNFLPTKAKYRVYIIDEVHMLSAGAFNALLKTLEEPPEHVKFILATTEPQKLPATILSRCQRFDFKKIPNADIVKRLKIVCDESKIEYEEDALNIIAVLAEGAMRDALSILERCVQDGENKIDSEKVKDLVGIPKTVHIHAITKAIVEYNVESALATIEEVLNEGKDLTNFIWEIIKYNKDILVYEATGRLEIYNEEEQNAIKELAKTVSKDRLVNIVYQLSELERDLKMSTQKTIMFQAGIIKMCDKTIPAQVVPAQASLAQAAPTQTATTPAPVQQAPAQAPNPAQAQAPAQSVAPRPQPAPAQTQASKPTPSGFWAQVLEELKNKGKRTLIMALSQTYAKEASDLTVEVYFPRTMNEYEKSTWSRQENIRELTDVVSTVLGKTMHIKFLDKPATPTESNVSNSANDLQKLAEGNDIPFTFS